MVATLRRELITALATVFAGALFFGAAAVILILPRLSSPVEAIPILAFLLIADVVVFAHFGRMLVQRRVLEPLQRMIDGAEAIAAGDLDRRLPTDTTQELCQLAKAVNQMAEKLISNQALLAANIRSLEDTNRQLTEARDEVIRAEKLASVGRLAAGIAHEIGNPLGAILGYLALIGKNTDERRAELTASAEREARRIDRIVRGLLDYARPREMAARPIDVNLISAQTIELLTTQGRLSGVKVDTELQRGLAEVFAEPYQLQQVLVNLLLNAVDALEGAESPSISLRTRAARFDPPIRLPARRKGDPPEIDYSHRRRYHQTPRLPREAPFRPGERLVEIEITDNGPGVPQELVGQLFDPFVTSKEPGKGTGLGLAVVARLVDGMDGTIRLDSSPGQGATFTIILPAAEAEDQPTAAS